MRVLFLALLALSVAVAFGQEAVGPRPQGRGPFGTGFPSFTFPPRPARTTEPEAEVMTDAPMDEVTEPGMVEDEPEIIEVPVDEEEEDDEVETGVQSVELDDEKMSDAEKMCRPRRRAQQIKKFAKINKKMMKNAKKLAKVASKVGNQKAKKGVQKLGKIAKGLAQRKQQQQKQQRGQRGQSTPGRRNLGALLRIHRRRGQSEARGDRRPGRSDDRRPGRSDERRGEGKGKQDREPAEIKSGELSDGK